MPLNSQRSGIMIVALFCGVGCNTITALTGSAFEGQADSTCGGTKNCGGFDVVDLVQVHTVLLSKTAFHKPGRGRAAAIVRSLSLLQNHFGTQVGMPDLSGLQQSMAQLVSVSMDHKDATSDPDTTTLTLDAIEEEMLSLSDGMSELKNITQSSLYEKRQAFDNCEDKINRHHFSSNHSNSIEQKEAHSDCRTTEWKLKVAHQDKYDALSRLVESPQPPACMNEVGTPSHTVDDIDSLLDCVKEISVWAEAYGSSLKNAKNESDEAWKEYTAWMPSCKKLQLGYEFAFCSYRLSLTSSCAEYEECYVAANHEEKEEVLQAEATEKQLKTEYRAVHRIICLVKVLQANSTEQAGLLDGCLSAIYSTENLTITYPGPAPPRASCNISNVTIYPCLDAWVENEYKSKEWYKGGAETETCTACDSESNEAEAAADVFP